MPKLNEWDPKGIGLALHFLFYNVKNNESSNRAFRGKGIIALI